MRQPRTGEWTDGFDPENVPPDTRGRDERIPASFWLGSLCVIVVIAVVLALAVFGLQVLFGWA